ADLAQPVVHVFERPEPLPVLAGLADELLAPCLQVGADAERTAGAGDDDNTDLVVPARVLAGAGKLAQHAEIERVQHLGPVEADRPPPRLFSKRETLETP